jgi:hypothetical protein
VTWIALHVGLSLASAAVLWPMLRAPRFPWTAPELVFDVPVATFDSRGF